MNNNYENTVGAAFGFDDEITISNSVGSVLIDEGPAQFTVTDFSRGRFAGSAKMSPGPQANLTLRVTDARGQSANIRVSLILNEKMLWKITNFFRSTNLISAASDGSRMTLPWSRVVGASGICEIEHATWTDNTGANRVSAQVKDFLYGTSAAICANAQTAHEMENKTMPAQQAPTVPPIFQNNPPQQQPTSYEQYMMQHAQYNPAGAYTPVSGDIL